MSTLTLARDRRPGYGRLTRVELRKMVDTRAGFWLLIGVAAATVLVVAIRALTGTAEDHTLRSMMLVALQPAAVLLPVAGILLVTSEWSQRTGLITFVLVPLRSRILVAKLLAALVLALLSLAVCFGAGVAGTALAGSDAGGVWSYSPALVGQAAFYLSSAMVIGVAFGAVLLASAPAIVAYFVLPIAWAALGSLSFLADMAPWVDTARASEPLTEGAMNATEWAHVGTAFSLWMLLPLAIGAYRVTRRAIAA